MSILVTTDKFHDPGELLAAILNLGVMAERIGGGRTIHVHWDDPETFPLKGDPRVWAIDPVRTTTRGLGAIERDAFDLPRDLAGSRGNWSIPRIIRRDPPWDLRLHPGPFPVFYEAGLDGAGVDIYIMDTGCRVNHVEFGGRASIVYENFVTPNGDVQGHGTGCAAMAAGAISGIARGAAIKSFKTLENDNTGNNFNMAAAMQAALNHYQSGSEVALNRPAVVNMSFGGPNIDNSHRDLISQMIAAGMFVVVAAGNDIDLIGTAGGEQTFYPALYDYVMCIGGSNVLDQPYETGDGFGTNYGPNVDLVAGAQRVRIGYGNGDDNRFVMANGTSFAAPAVVGVIACLLTGQPRPTLGRQGQMRMLWNLRKMATTGRLQTVRGAINALPDRLLYLDPARTTPVDLVTVPMDPGYVPPTPTTLANPSFETGSPNVNAAIPSWVENSQGVTSAYDHIGIRNDVAAQDGSNYLSFARTNTLTTNHAAYVETAVTVSLPFDKAELAAAANETISITYGARINNSGVAPGRTRPVIYWYDEDGELCGDVFGSYQTLPAGAPGTAWADYTWGPWNIPPMARRFILRIWAWSDAGANNMNVLVDNVRFNYGSDP